MGRTYTPQYMRIRNDIINQINNGELKKDQRLPSERDIADAFGVSRITVVGALHGLDEQGIIRKVRGSGSYINCSSVDYEEPGEMFGSFFGSARITVRHGILICSPQTFFIVKTLAALFRMENPDIKVEVVMLNPEGYVGSEDPYLGLIGAGKPPATGEFFFHSDYSAINALYPLENLPGFNELTARLVPGAAFPTLDMSNEPHVHAVALKTNARHCIVNVDFLKQAGICNLPETLTFEHIDEWCARLGRYAEKHPGTYGTSMPLPFGWHNVIGYFPYLWGDAAGVDSSARSFMEVLNGKSCLEGLHALARWYQCSRPAPPEDDDMFLFGKIGLVLSSTRHPWHVNGMPHRSSPFRYYSIPVSYGRKQSVSLLGNFSVGIFKGGVRNEEELHAAWRWLKFLFQKRAQYPLSLDFDSPARLDAGSRLAELPDFYKNTMLHTIRNARPQFDFKNIRAALSVFGDELRLCLCGEITPEQCIENTMKRLPDIIRMP